jgi:TPP-dependent pyruvate/acetoin dehydrogenase alpha subunit
MPRKAVDRTRTGEAKFVGPSMLEADCPRCGKHIHLEIKRKSH